MKKLLLILILFLIYPIIVAFNFMIVENALIYWGYDNVLRSIMWVGPDGSIGIRGEIPNERTAIMLMPTMNGSAPFGAKAELVLYRITDGTATHPEENWERFSTLP